MSEYNVINYLLLQAYEQDYSNIILTTDTQFYKKDGAWQHLTIEDNVALSLQDELAELLSEQKNKNNSNGMRKVYDFAYSIPHGERYRGNISQDMSKIVAVFRPIRTNIPSLADLYMPSSLARLVMKPHGIIIVSGPTDSGKSTTLAAMINHVNLHLAKHIITIEDPIEYVYPPGKSIISQYEIGDMLLSFQEGLLAALRQAPDIILVGELRDRQSIETALRAAETGHLVLSTLHASSIPEAVDRLKQYFPGDMQKQIQQQFANCFQGIIVQQLLPGKNGGRVAAQEIMLRNTATIGMIKTERYQLDITLRASDGMQTMNDALDELRISGHIN